MLGTMRHLLEKVPPTTVLPLYREHVLLLSDAYTHHHLFLPLRHGPRPIARMACRHVGRRGRGSSEPSSSWGVFYTLSRRHRRPVGPVGRVRRHGTAVCTDSPWARPRAAVHPPYHHPRRRRRTRGRPRLVVRMLCRQRGGCDPSKDPGRVQWGRGIVGHHGHSVGGRRHRGRCDCHRPSVCCLGFGGGPRGLVPCMVGLAVRHGSVSLVRLDLVDGRRRGRQQLPRLARNGSTVCLVGYVAI